MGTELDSIDLTTNQRKTVVDLLRRHLPNTTAWAYGSRVKFTSKPKSDLDLVVFADPEQSLQVAALKEAFEASDLPFRVDLFVWDEVPEKFRMNIEAERVVLMERKERTIDFPTKRLGDLCSKIGSGATPRGGSKVYLDSGEVSLIRSQNVRNDRFDKNGLVYIERRHAKQLDGVEVADGDVLLNITGDSVARCCQVDASILPARVNQHVAIVRPRSDQLDARFLRYFLISPEMQNHMLAWAGSGGTRNALTKGMIEEFSVPVPSLPEQKAIAHVLGSLDDKIELNRQMNATLEAMAQALFKSWFVDFDPVIDNALAAGNPIPDELQARASARESLGDARKPLPDLSAEALAKAEHLQNLFPATFTHTEELGWIPEGWDTQPLYNIASFINGAAYKNFHFTDEAGALPVVKIAEVKGGISSQTKFTKTELAEKYRIDDGDILFSWSGNPDTSIDTFVWTGGPGWLNQHIFRVALKAEEDRDLVYYQLKLLRPVFAEIARNKQTTGLGHVTAQDMKRLHVIRAPDSIKIAFNKLVSPLFDRWYANLVHSRDLAKTRDTLLPKLLSGDLRLPIEELEVAV